MLGGDCVYSLVELLVYIFLGFLVDSVDKELLADIDKLSMDHPSIDLVEQNFMTHEENPGKHVFDGWVPSGTSLVQDV